jgi:hypothetical protein
MRAWRVVRKISTAVGRSRWRRGYTATTWSYSLDDARQGGDELNYMDMIYLGAYQDSS